MHFFFNTDRAPGEKQNRTSSWESPSPEPGSSQTHISSIPSPSRLLLPAPLPTKPVPAATASPTQPRAAPGRMKNAHSSHPCCPRDLRGFSLPSLPRAHEMPKLSCDYRSLCNAVSPGRCRCGCLGFSLHRDTQSSAEGAQKSRPKSQARGARSTRRAGSAGKGKAPEGKGCGGEKPPGFTARARYPVTLPFLTSPLTTPAPNPSVAAGPAGDTNRDRAGAEGTRSTSKSKPQSCRNVVFPPLRSGNSPSLPSPRQVTQPRPRGEGTRSPRPPGRASNPR